MKKMKNLKMKKNIKKIIFTALAVMVIPILNVNAQSYYKNQNGVEMSKNDLEYLLEFYEMPVIEEMSLEQFKNEKKYNFQKELSKDVFIKEKKYYDNTGKISQSENYEITKEEFESETNISPQWDDTGVSCSTTAAYNNDCWETNYRKLVYTQYITDIHNYYKRITLTNTWKTIPTEKYFDVIGLMWEKGTMDIANIQAYQYYNDGNGEKSISYNYPNGSNTVYKTNGNYQGVANAQNIINSVKSNLKNKLIIEGTYNAFGGDPIVWGAYQHGIMNNSLNDALAFTFDKSGYGGVFKFDNYAASKFDRVKGVSNK